MFGGGVEDLATSGTSLSVSPTEDKTYVLTATNTAGSVTMSLTITVTARTTTTPALVSGGLRTMTFASNGAGDALYYTFVENAQTAAIKFGSENPPDSNFHFVNIYPSTHRTLANQMLFGYDKAILAGKTPVKIFHNGTSYDLTFVAEYTQTPITATYYTADAVGLGSDPATIDVEFSDGSRLYTAT